MPIENGKPKPGGAFPQNETFIVKKKNPDMRKIYPGYYS